MKVVRAHPIKYGNTKKKRQQFSGTPCTSQKFAAVFYVCHIGNIVWVEAEYFIFVCVRVNTALYTMSWRARTKYTNT